MVGISGTLITRIYRIWRDGDSLPSGMNLRKSIAGQTMRLIIN